MEEKDDRPKWLVELENRKRKPRLAHEAGAGAPCYRCEADCPGLDLHFWRKICKNCKCSRDDHDVNSDDFPQFDLLFGPSGRSKGKPVLLRLNKTKPDQKSVAFEWTPPNVTEDLAADYMKALPEDKLPIAGSAGAALRKQQLQKQLPLHDIDHQVCDQLSELERKEFEKYLQNLKKYVGQGQVIKVMGARPFNKNLMTPANASDMHRLLSPQHKAYAATVSQGLTLRTPSSFINKTSPPSYASPLYKNSLAKDSEEYNRLCANLENISVASGAATSEMVKGKYHSSGVPCISPRRGSSPVLRGELLQSNSPVRSYAQEEHVPQSVQNYAEGLASVLLQESGKSQSANADATKYSVHNPASEIASAADLQRENALIAERLVSEALSAPSAAKAGEIVGSTLDQRELMFIREKLSDKYSMKDEPKVLNSNAISPFQKHQPASGLMNKSTAIVQDVQVPCSNNNNSLNTQRVNAKLENSRLPNTELINSDCQHIQIFPNEAREFQKQEMENSHVQAIEEPAKVPHKCHQCKSDIHTGDVVVTADRAQDAVWHPGCFCCSVCNELLADLVYFYYKNKLYCGRDLAVLLEIPRCFACDELIFVREYTVAEGHTYHVRHFCCWDCDIPLAGQQYISEEDRPLCLPCYQNSYAKTCKTCDKVIAADQQGVAIKNLNFHAVDSCFRCYTCKKSLLNGRMSIKQDKPFCSKECIAEFLSNPV